MHYVDEKPLQKDCGQPTNASMMLPHHFFPTQFAPAPFFFGVRSINILPSHPRHSAMPNSLPNISDPAFTFIPNPVHDNMYPGYYSFYQQLGVFPQHSSHAPYPLLPQCRWMPRSDYSDETQTSSQNDSSFYQLLEPLAEEPRDCAYEANIAPEQNQNLEVFPNFFARKPDLKFFPNAFEYLKKVFKEETINAENTQLTPFEKLLVYSFLVRKYPFLKKKT